jgi:nicotinamidase-related amidase
MLPELDHGTTALVLIDLQRGVAAMPVEPHSAAAVTSRAADLARAFRAAGAPVVLVRVAFSGDGGEVLRTDVDQPRPAAGPRPPEYLQFVDELEQTETDIVVTKHNWGAFHGTDLDVQLRRRGIATIVLAGIATNMGVESTARAAHEHAYNLVLVEDAMAALTSRDHAFALERIFPRIGRVASTSEVVDALR